MRISFAELESILVPPGHLSQTDFTRLASEFSSDPEKIIEAIIGNGFLNDAQIGKLLAEHLDMPFSDLSTEKIDPEAVLSIPEPVSEARGVIAFDKSEGIIKIGMVDPGDLEMRHNLVKKFAGKVEFYLITPIGIADAQNLYGSGFESKIKSLAEDFLASGKDSSTREDVAAMMTDMIIEYGILSHASDIHFEPGNEDLSVRFRIDGVMHKVLVLPKQFLDIFISRIKILSKMRTDEHFAAQDGKMKFKHKGSQVDLRVSVLPIIHGENAVLRLLSEESRHSGISSLGMSEDDLEKVRKAIRNPHGMILVTGPTGCGKTTTLYEIVKILNTKDVHISTIEDPVEYEIDGVSQIQVNPKTNLSFAQGLRAIVRQDPDIIMVGEIRDKETAGIAINSAMTGHLVISTLHTNDAPTSAIRLMDMEVEPFLIASTLNLVIAQRLVRTVCEKCRYSYELSEDLPLIQSIPGLEESLKGIFSMELSRIRVYKGSGCPACSDTGYQGRIGIFEVMEITREVKASFSGNTGRDGIEAAARRQGMRTMLEDGFEKVFRGATTIEEVLRVTR